MFHRRKMFKNHLALSQSRAQEEPMEIPPMKPVEPVKPVKHIEVPKPVVPRTPIRFGRPKFTKTIMEIPKELPYDIIPLNKITIITPCCRPENLPTLFSSIRFSHIYKWIIVYDTSKDRTYTHQFDHPQIVETECNLLGSAGHPQRNAGMALVDDGFIYFLDDDNIIHPNFWPLLHGLNPLNFYTFNQQRTPTSILPGEHINVGTIDTAMFIVHKSHLGGIEWETQRYDADGIFISNINKHNMGKHIYLNVVGCFYNYITTLPTLTDESPIALILTCKREYYIKRLQSNFKTWLYLVNAGYRVIYLYADKSLTEPSLTQQSLFVTELTVPVEESYEMLTEKMLSAYSFLSKQFPDSVGILKMDDNTIIQDPTCLQELQQHVQNGAEYIGININSVKKDQILTTNNNFRYTKQKHFNTRASHTFTYYGGPFYWISNRLLNAINNTTDISYFPWEDLNIGYRVSLITPEPVLFLAPWKTHSRITWVDDFEITQSKQKCRIALHGQLGNHMFQLAALLRHCRVNNMEPQFYILEPTKQEKYYDTMLPYCKQFRTLEPVDTKSVPYKYIPIPSDATTLHGYLQSSKYFADEKEYIKQMFTPDPSVQTICNLKHESLLQLKNEFDVVVVHVRRGDYLKLPQFHGILSHKYFNNAIALMRKKLSNPTFLIFSDDVEYSRKTFIGDNIRVINEPDPNITFCLMKQFHNFILSNSTFSWWACYLSEHQQNVIVPDRWFGPMGPQDFQDIYEPEWIRIKAE